jgi:predicted permease
MPSATQYTMMSMEYGGNERLASIGVFLTTILSLVTVPLIVFLMLK